MPTFEIRHLQPADAERIVSCFAATYGDSYANEAFYDAEALAQAMSSGALNCVGAIDAEGRLIAHMAMSLREGATSAELGNTVVDPIARGEGLAWQVGAELSKWARELGHTGFVHYPTTDHHIMQRQAAKNGFETGLMLGYIPATTDGKTNGRGKTSPAPTERQAATIVYEPYVDAKSTTEYLPSYCEKLVTEFVASTRLTRRWLVPKSADLLATRGKVEMFRKRGLHRAIITAVGKDVSSFISRNELSRYPCHQIDFLMHDTGIEDGVNAALDLGYFFCGWLPGLVGSDVLRVQKVDIKQTNMHPSLVNDTAKNILRTIEGSFIR